MRNALLSLLKDDTTLTSLGVQKVYMAPAVDTPRERCFIVVRQNVTRQAIGWLGPTNVTITVNSRDADFAKLDRIVKRVKALLENLTHRVGTDGSLAQVRWLGDSGDAVDEGWDTYTRSSDFECNAGVIS